MSNSYCPRQMDASSPPATETPPKLESKIQTVGCNEAILASSGSRFCREGWETRGETDERHMRRRSIRRSTRFPSRMLIKTDEDLTRIIHSSRYQAHTCKSCRRIRQSNAKRVQATTHDHALTAQTLAAVGLGRRF